MSASKNTHNFFNIFVASFNVLTDGGFKWSESISLFLDVNLINPLVTLINIWLSLLQLFIKCVYSLSH